MTLVGQGVRVIRNGAHLAAMRRDRREGVASPRSDWQRCRDVQRDEPVRPASCDGCSGCDGNERGRAPLICAPSCGRVETVPLIPF